MCDAECQEQFDANAKEEASEAENVILLITFILLVGLVYITGLIVWVWCNRNPIDGVGAISQTDRVSMKSTALQPLPSLKSSVGLEGGVLLLLGALIQQQCQDKINNTLIACRLAEDRQFIANHREATDATVRLATCEDIDDDIAEDPDEVVIHNVTYI